MSASAILQIRDGYFWDPAKGEYFLPRGFAYQTFNPPVFANQSFEQLDYDLTEFKKLYANSVRAEFVWSEVEIENDVYDWSKPDHLIEKAEELGLKLFILIGFQYPPPWFPEEWYGTNDRGERSDVLNYEHPEARAAYQDHIARVAARYKDTSAIGGWILGNEYAYFDLWESPELYPVRRFLGYDPISQQAFQRFLKNRYSTNVAALNANWKTQFTTFEDIPMPLRYPSDRHNPGYHDLIQWRQTSIGDFVALGALAARAADPNHVITYSMVGGIFNGADANNTCEDARIIVERCALAGAPLDFWSVNNYAWATLGSELRSADYGVAKYQAVTRLPVMISETGHSSTEDLLPGAAPRQPKAVPSQIWESVMSGAIGTHLFHWSDRDQFTTNYFLRERGFGIVGQNRIPKPYVFDNVLEMFRRMAEIRLDHLFGGSVNPPADVQFFWSEAADMGWPRANQENAMIWGALRRLGYQPDIIDDSQFDSGAYTNAPALLLSRAYQMHPKHLDALTASVLPAGIHIHANADLPGQFNAYHAPNPNWAQQMRAIFGLDIAQAFAGFDGGATNIAYAPLHLVGRDQLFGLGYSQDLLTWKIWHGVKAVAGSTPVTHQGVNATQPAMPALQLTSSRKAKTAVNTFALGDTFGSNPERLWDIRDTWLRAIYRAHFGIVPAIELTGAGSRYVMPDYRICRNGTLLLSLLNEHTNDATVTITAPSLLAGHTVENLTSGGILERDSDGVLTVPVDGDDLVLLYAYNAPPESSLVNRSDAKLWIKEAPRQVWPNGKKQLLHVGYDVSAAELFAVGTFEHADGRTPSASRCARVPVSGTGTATLEISLPDSDLGLEMYQSSIAGAEYVWRVWLETADRVRVSQTELPVRLAWPVRPRALPVTLKPGENYQVEVHWEELPSFEPDEFGTPLSRASLWESLKATREHYNVVLELISGRAIVASDAHVTRTGTGQHLFNIQVPPDATGPFQWVARLESSLDASDDVQESFEGRLLGDDPELIRPWVSYHYSEANNVNWLAQGIQAKGSHGAQSAFMVIENPPKPGSFAGFGIAYVFAEPWALPKNRAEWTNHVFSADFREENGRACVLELQFKDSSGRWIELTREYQPGPSGWDAVRGTAAEFVRPRHLDDFDSSSITEIVVNIRMTEKGVMYIGSFDNIILDRPEILQAGGLQYGLYLSNNDSSPDLDRDGLPDAFETGTGQYVSRTNTGTQSDSPDTDGDGVLDGAELLAGTNPVDSMDFLTITEAGRTSDGQMILRWPMRPDTRYAIYYSDDLDIGDPAILSNGHFRRLSPPTGPVLEAIDPETPNVRFYRLRAWPALE